MEADLASRSLEIYHLQPPAWRRPLLEAEDDSDSTTLTFPAFFPTHAGQEEDALSEKIVKDGFSAKTVVPTEAFSAHQMVYEKLFESTALDELSNIIGKVQQSVDDAAPTPLPYAFKLPPRVTWNDQKKEAWIADLANMEVPFAKLAKNVPNGFKGEKLLEMLTTRHIPLVRAIWLIRVVGFGEMISNKSRPDYEPSMFVVEWTTAVWDHVRKQIAEITIPTVNLVSRPGMNIKGKAKATFSDPEVCERWTNKMAYILSLLQLLFHEELLSREDFVRILSQQLESANLAQIPVLLLIWESICQAVLQSLSLVRRFVQIVLDRLVEASNSSSPANFVRDQMATALQRVFLSCPNAFLYPSLWYQHHDDLHQILAVELPSKVTDQSDSDENAANLTLTWQKFAELNQQHLPINASTALESSWQDVMRFSRLLDAFEVCMDPNLVLDELAVSTLEAEDKIILTCSWASTCQRHGFYRSKVAVRLMRMILEAVSELDFKVILFEWMDRIQNETDIDRNSLCSLLSELCQAGSLEPNDYLNHVVTQASASIKGASDLHMHLVKNLPMLGNHAACSTRRNIFLGKSKSDTRAEALALSSARCRILDALPCLLTCDQKPESGKPPSTGSAVAAVRALDSRARKESLLSRWLIPTLQNFLPTSDDNLEACLDVLLELGAIAEAVKLCKRVLESDRAIRLFSPISAFILSSRAEIICGEHTASLLESLKHACRFAEQAGLNTKRLIRTMDGLLQPSRSHLPTWMDADAIPTSLLEFALSKIAGLATNLATKINTRLEFMDLINEQTAHPHLFWTAITKYVESFEKSETILAIEQIVNFIRETLTSIKTDFTASVSCYLDSLASANISPSLNVCALIAGLIRANVLELTPILRWFILPILQQTLVGGDLDVLRSLQSVVSALLDGVFGRPTPDTATFTQRTSVIAALRQDEGSLFIYALVQHLCDAESWLATVNRDASEFRRIRMEICNNPDIRNCARNSNTQWPAMLSAICHLDGNPDRSYLLAESVHIICDIGLKPPKDPSLIAWRCLSGSLFVDSAFTMASQSTATRYEPFSMEATTSLLSESNLAEKLTLADNPSSRAQLVDIYLTQIQTCLSPDESALPAIVDRMCRMLSKQAKTQFSIDSKLTDLLAAASKRFMRLLDDSGPESEATSQRLECLHKLVCVLLQLGTSWTHFEISCADLFEALIKSRRDFTGKNGFISHLSMMLNLDADKRSSLIGAAADKTKALAHECLNTTIHAQDIGKAWSRIEMATLASSSHQNDWRINSGCTDLSSLQLRFIEKVTVDAEFLESKQSGPYAMQDQRNFESELETTRESLWLHDSRRRLVPTLLNGSKRERVAHVPGGVKRKEGPSNTPIPNKKAKMSV